MHSNEKQDALVLTGHWFSPDFDCTDHTASHMKKLLQLNDDCTPIAGGFADGGSPSGELWGIIKASDAAKLKDPEREAVEEAMWMRTVSSRDKLRTTQQDIYNASMGRGQ